MWSSMPAGSSTPKLSDSCIQEQAAGRMSGRRQGLADLKPTGVCANARPDESGGRYAALASRAGPLGSQYPRYGPMPVKMDALNIRPALRARALSASQSGGRNPAAGRPWREYVLAGGLMSYGVNLVDQWRRTASYIDKILKGADPGVLPIQHRTNFEVVINLKTAKAIGLEIPAPTLAQAAEVLQVLGPLMAPGGKSWHRNTMGSDRRVNCRGSHVTGEVDHGGRTVEENAATGLALWQSLREELVAKQPVKDRWGARACASSAGQSSDR